MSIHYSTEIAQAIQDVLIQERWNFRFQEARGVFHFSYCLRHKLRDMQFTIPVLMTDFNVYCKLPVGVDKDDQETMAAMQQLLARLNLSIRCGSFELDPADGAIQFKTYVDCDGLDTPTENMIRNSIYSPLEAVSLYENEIGKILFGGTVQQEQTRTPSQDPMQLFDQDIVEEDDTSNPESFIHGTWGHESPYPHDAGFYEEEDEEEADMDAENHSGPRPRSQPRRAQPRKSPF